MPAPNHPSAAAACATDRTQSVPPFAHHPGCAAPAPAEAPRCHPAPASRADRHDWPLHKQPTTRKEGRMPRSTHTYIHAHTHTRRVVSHHDCADAKPQLRCTQVRHAARTRGKDTWQRHVATTHGKNGVARPVNVPQDHTACVTAVPPPRSSVTATQ
jgi:hypothetical protein